MKNKQADKHYTVDADTLNIRHYDEISTDSQYTPPLPKPTANKFTELFKEQHVFQLLDTVGQTATGLDKIPFWFLCITAPCISAVCTHCLLIQFVALLLQGGIPVLSHRFQRFHRRSPDKLTTFKKVQKFPVSEASDNNSVTLNIN